MASSPLSTHPTSLNDLPPELCWTLTQYLGPKDLGTVRLLNGYWNETAKTTLRKRNRLTFNFWNVAKLAQFNDTFAAYTPTYHIAAGRFCFHLPALDTVAATEHLVTFVQRFGHLVTTLSVDLYKFPPPFHFGPNTEEKAWFEEPCQRDTVFAHVTFLLQEVRGQVQDLELLYYGGLRPCVFGHGPFPRLQTLTVGNNFIRGAPSALDTLEEDAILLLSRSVPAIQRFELKSFHGSNGGDPMFLVCLLQNLVRVNALVEVKLDMSLTCSSRDAAGQTANRALIAELMTVSVRIVELSLFVRKDLETLRWALNWIGAQSDWLKKLKLEAGTEAIPAGLKLPSLRALEELNYVQRTVESLIQYSSADYFPSLRTVTTASTGNDFTVALPQVTDLTLRRTGVTGIVALELGQYGQALFQLPPFPNVETLTSPVKFIDLASIVKLQSLRRLVVTRDFESRNRFAFWKKVTHGALKLTLEQIRALPEPSEDEVRERVEPCLADLANLKELKMVVYEYPTDVTIVDLDALLFISKTKRLQRLQKLELEVRPRVAVLQVYLNELRQYHDSVFETN